MANLLLLTVDRRGAKAAALPDSACPACGGHYRVAMRSGEVLCLECLATDRSPHHNFEPIGAPAAARDVAERSRS